MTDNGIGALYAALAKAQAAITHAKKGKENPFFKSSYADLAAIYDACRKQLSDNGLSVLQILHEAETGLQLITILGHSSGHEIRSAMKIQPVKNDPQGVGSAITYARRYALAAIVGVAAEDEDDDGNEASKPSKEPVKERAWPECPKCGRADRIVAATKNPAAGAYGCTACKHQFDPVEE